MATATVKGGLFEQYGTTLTQVQGTPPLRRAVARALQNMPVMRELMDTLNGVAPGQTALKTRARVQAVEELGGKRVIENVNLVNRASTAGDAFDIGYDLFNMTVRTSFGANPPANKDGNPLGTR